VANGVVLVGGDLFFHDASVHILGATLRLDAPGLDYAATAPRPRLDYMAQMQRNVTLLVLVEVVNAG
jgi:hypothetical protein